MRLFPIAAILIALPITAFGGETQGGPFLTLSCPAKGSSVRSFDLSTGVAPWIASGPGVPGGAALATAIDPASLPRGWSARLPGARWIQAMPVSRMTAHAAGSYIFTLEFDVPKGKPRPRLRFSGESIGDEGFDLNLVEPIPGISGTGYGDSSLDEAGQDEVQQVLLERSADQSGRPLGTHAGRYRIEVAVPNSQPTASPVGLLTKLSLTVTCGKAR
jgi:hypothetical protein